ncbi:MAG: hypothetical protein K8W52_04375 [Deltaproteobacteria bacterium]|nr:hypothetical protein [Deltaproteobacteria bacterium]
MSEGPFRAQEHREPAASDSENGRFERGIARYEVGPYYVVVSRRRLPPLGWILVPLGVVIFASTSAYLDLHARRTLIGYAVGTVAALACVNVGMFFMRPLPLRPHRIVCSPSGVFIDKRWYDQTDVRGFDVVVRTRRYRVDRVYTVGIRVFAGGRPWTLWLYRTYGRRWARAEVVVAALRHAIGLPAMSTAPQDLDT